MDIPMTIGFMWHCASIILYLYWSVKLGIPHNHCSFDITEQHTPN